VKGGEAVALRGDPDRPYTRGSLCNKVADYLSYARSPERLLYPMRRVGPKGSGELVRISWDEALETIAARLREAIAAHGAVHHDNRVRVEPVCDRPRRSV